MRAQVASWVVLGCICLAGCQGRQKPVASEKTAVATAAVSAKPPARSTESIREFRFPEPERLVAIGDLHGDVSAARAALKLAGAVDDSDTWVGAKLVVVQTGDQLDRGDDERAIVDLFDSLAEQAARAGGRVLALNGNHETMNVQGDFRYVTEQGLNFGDVAPASPHAGAAPERFRQRAEAFLPGGAYAKSLSRRPVVAVVGSSAFVHGGILPEHVEYGLDRINREVMTWMAGESSQMPPAIAAENALVWTRAYGGPEAPDVCQVVRRVLDGLRVRRIVVGHTVQKDGVTSICDGSVWRIDVGLAKYYGDSPISILEIKGARVGVLTAPR
ncbi:MAG TPA: metallophosphoesterase [Polyangiaceae bacterium]|nr:metallophosphoesterase [Polyangiaceae bacterium]